MIWRHFFRCTDSPSSVFGVCRCTAVGPVAGSSLRRVATSYGPPGHPNCRGAIAAGRRVDGIKHDGAQPVCGRIASHVLGCDAVCVRPGVLSFATGRRCCAGAPRTSGINSDDGHGPLASLFGPGAPGPDTVHQDGDCPGCPECQLRLSG